MSRPYIITDTPERKMEVSVDAGGSVLIRKKWVNYPEEVWVVREMVINGDEWERIEEERKKGKK